jgi:hypothetical protein
MLSMDQIYPNVACLCRGKTRKSTSDVPARRLGQVEAYITVREDLFRARPQMVCYRASTAIFNDVGIQH